MNLTPEQFLAHEAMLATWARGGFIQGRPKSACPENLNTWRTFKRDELPPLQECNEYRIRPEPAYRAWTEDEVPIGALFQWQDGFKRIGIITKITGINGFSTTIIDCVSFGNAFTYGLWQYPGATDGWKVCGTLVTP